MVATTNGQVFTTRGFLLIKTIVTCCGMSSIVPLLNHMKITGTKFEEDDLMREYVDRYKDEDVLEDEDVLGLITSLRT